MAALRRMVYAVKIFLAGQNGMHRMLNITFREREREAGMKVYLAGAQTGGNIPPAERREILMLPQKEGVCDCSLQGSPRGGAGGVRPYYPQA